MTPFLFLDFETVLQDGAPSFALLILTQLSLLGQSENVKELFWSHCHTVWFAPQ